MIDILSLIKKSEDLLGELKSVAGLIGVKGHVLDLKVALDDYEKVQSKGTWPINIEGDLALEYLRAAADSESILADYEDPDLRIRYVELEEELRSQYDKALNILKKAEDIFKKEEKR